ncbi:hypothetical protein CMZ81_06680, partial [Lysobacteraceae bacterium NML93-0793]
MLVAIGVAWQLRPTPEVRPEPWSEAPAAMQAMRAPVASSAADRGETPAPATERTRAAADVPQAAAVPAETPAEPRAPERQAAVATAPALT